MNITAMTNWNGLWKYLIQCSSLFFFICLVGNYTAAAQTVGRGSFNKQRLYNPVVTSNYTYTSADSVDYFPKYPDPMSVMFKSMIIPGWGQIINGQIWKVPIIYALLGGLTYYSIYLTKRYHDYRAAYYNINDQTPDDLRFGPTPDYISPNTSLSYLKRKRNQLHNKRDLSYLYVVLAYGLNLVDAYVFAHLKPFNVTKDLTADARLTPTVVDRRAPGFTLSIDFY